MTDFKPKVTRDHILDWLESNGYRVDMENHRLIPELTLEAQDDLIKYLRKKEEDDDERRS